MVVLVARKWHSELQIRLEIFISSVYRYSTQVVVTQIKVCDAFYESAISIMGRFQK